MQANSTVSQETHVAASLNDGALLAIADNAWVAGNVGGNINIARTLYVPQGATVGAGVRATATVRQPVTVAAPCDCSATALLGQSVAQIVAAHAAKNDNALIHLSPTALATPSATSVRLDLPCGRYYLAGIKQSSTTSVTVFAHGQTALFIDGDVTGDVVSFVLDPAAEFDVFVTGTIITQNQLIIGSPNYPALSRTYLGGTAPMDLAGEAGRTAGNLYMGTTPLTVSSHLVLYGGLIAASIANQENIELHYDRAVLGLPSCSSGPPAMCGSCKDCGNQACVNGTCGQCSSSAQCCPPLVCQAGSCRAAPQ
jgi:hypothetical protein